MTTKNLESWEKIGKGAAAEIKITPQQIKYIEARGFLGYELAYLLGGRIEFIETPWKNFILRILEFLFPIAPICRWYPSENSELELVGYHAQKETKVYRFTSGRDPVIVFFVDYKPEPPAGGGYIRSLFKVPQLDISNFLRPPFEKNNDNLKIGHLLREGMFVRKFMPIPMTDGAKDKFKETHFEICKGLWEEFSGE